MSPLPDSDKTEAPASDASWLRLFHAGDPDVLSEVYSDYFRLVANVARGTATEVDAENIVHNVFLRLISNAEARRSFQGGRFASWLTVVTRNEALGVMRSRRRELAALDASQTEVGQEPTGRDLGLEAQQLVRRFRDEGLPAKWAPVFEARFLRQLSQREAARALGIRRTTLAYQELRITQLLRRYIMTAERGQ